MHVEPFSDELRQQRPQIYERDRYLGDSLEFLLSAFMYSSNSPREDSYMQIRFRLILMFLPGGQKFLPGGPARHLVLFHSLFMDIWISATSGAATIVLDQGAMLSSLSWFLSGAVWLY
jgi:hypothetical protein